MRNPLACDQEEVHEVYRRWRRLADAYAGPGALVGEVNLDPARAARYTRADELHQAFAFGFLTAPWDADDGAGSPRTCWRRRAARRRRRDVGRRTTTSSDADPV